MKDDISCQSRTCPQRTLINKSDVNRCECCDYVFRIKMSDAASVRAEIEKLVHMTNGVRAEINRDNLNGIIDLSEDKDVNTAEASSLPVEVEVEEKSWSCVRCTFLNHPALDVCECCSFERLSEPEVPEQKLWSELPATWSQPKLGKAVTLVELKPSDPEFMEVECNVRKTSEKSLKEIVSVQRIENAHLYSLYPLMRNQMNGANGEAVQNERLLWHGTALDTVKTIGQRGFNRSYCGKNATAFGKGVYFATSFAYSAQDIYIYIFIYYKIVHRVQIKKKKIVKRK